LSGSVFFFFFNSTRCSLAVAHSIPLLLLSRWNVLSAMFGSGGLHCGCRGQRQEPHCAYELYSNSEMPLARQEIEILGCRPMAIYHGMLAQGEQLHRSAIGCKVYRLRGKKTRRECLAGVQF